ncbi:MAG: NADH-quinone oxidoreductase subunit N [Bacteroidia bacterium]|nr:NADH-quinone oxidoreductase subunit N [Bacteroidia bacterium]
MVTLIILAGLGLISLFSEIFSFRKILYPLILAGLAAAFVANITDWNTGGAIFNNMMHSDHFSVAFNGVLIATAFFWFLVSPGYFHDPTNRTDHFSLLLFSLTGATLLTSFSNMIMLFLGIEILSISLYVLAGSKKQDLASNEAALKYFLIGSFTTGFLLFGMALLYGASGSFNLEAISRFIANNQGQGNVLVYTGVILMMSALAFKVSATPFHFWAPDVYQGSPTVVTSFMSTVVKTAALAAFLRLFMYCFGTINGFWSGGIEIIAAASIIIGNLTAIFQDDFKRMIAYSGVSHAGYMLLAILAMNNSSASSLLYYSAGYSLSLLVAFSALLLVAKATGAETISAFNGLAKRNPLLAGITIIAMLSLAGIPPTAGFFGKYYIFSAALKSNYTGLVVLAVFGSLVGVLYYFRVIIVMFREGSDTRPVVASPGERIYLLLIAFLILFIGVWPGYLVSLL